MIEKTLREKPIASAGELHRFLTSLSEKISLKLPQAEALNKDVAALERIISKLSVASAKDEWREVWTMVNDMNNGFGGYVGDELGKNLNRLFDALWRDILDSYSEVKE